MRGRMKGSLPIAIAICILSGVVWGSSPTVVINEVAWGGSPLDPKAEWIELVNGSDEEIDLSGWRLVSSDGAPDILLSGRIGPLDGEDPKSGYFLLMRRGGEIPGVEPDGVYTGALTDRGETLYLYDRDGKLVDTANLPVEGEAIGWPAGTNGRGDPPFCSMERVDYRLPDRPDNWTTCRCNTPDRDEVCGTPKRENSSFNLPPVAGMTYAPEYPSPGEEVVFDAGPSFDENNPIVFYTWDFGDGSIASGQTASHTYAATGIYRVELTVEDSKGGSTTISAHITVSFPTPPIPDFSVISEEGRVLRVGDSITFRDESSGEGIGIVGWEWEFGDGTSGEGSSVAHTYSEPGEYTVSLTVTDERGSRATQTDSVLIASLPPTAQFTVEPPVPTTGERAEFAAAGSFDPDGKIAKFRWDFDGDGTIDLETEDPTVTYTYREGGTALPTLWVIDENGDTSEAYTVEIRVNAPPVAGFQISSFAAMELEGIAFTDCSYDEDGTITAWLWDFGDGETSCQSSSTHAFKADGDYTVSLTVTDDDSAQGTADALVTVTNLPPVASLSVDQTIRPTGAEFRFDGSGSNDPSPAGRIVAYEWDLDDDGGFDLKTTSPILSYAYADDGVYRVRLRVTDDDGASATSEPVTVTVKDRPAVVSRVEFTPLEPTDGDEVSFVPIAFDPDGTIICWLWEFGDGSTADVETPSHTFQDDGVYPISLTVTDDDGMKTVFQVEIKVANAPPIAEFTATVKGDKVTFDARSSYDPSPNGRIAHVAWDFGDGTTCPGEGGGCDGTDPLRPVHTFPAPGVYTVRLIVIDEDGGIGGAERRIRITG